MTQKGKFIPKFYSEEKLVKGMNTNGGKQIWTR